MKQISRITIYAVALLVVSLVVALSSALWKSKYTLVSFHSESDAAVRYSLYYTTEAGQYMSEYRRLVKNTPVGEGLVEFKIPERTVCRVRLDVAPVDAVKFPVARISDFRIEGRNEFSVQDFNVLRFNGSDVMNIGKEVLEVSAVPWISSYFVVTPPEQIIYGRYIDWLVLLSVMVLAFFASLKVVKYITSFKVIEGATRKDMIFLAFFFICLFIPMSHIDESVSSKEEKRTLARKPNIDKLFDPEYNYGTLFDKWYSDRFFGRSQLQKLYSKYDLDAAYKGDKRILVGKENWMFYKVHGNIDDVHNNAHFTREEMQAMARYLLDIDAWCKSHGKDFYYFVAPNKHNVYDEYYRYARRQNPERKGRVSEFVDYLRRETNIRVIFPIDELRSAKKEDYTYYKHDTHWNEYGGYIGYRELMAALSQTHQIATFSPRFSKRNMIGIDLEPMLPGCIKDTETMYPVVNNAPTGNVRKRCISRIKSGKGSVLESRYPGKKLSVFMLRDSFTTNMQKYLDETFGLIQYHWKYDLNRADLNNISKNSDIVILEQVERLVPYLKDLSFPK